MDDSAGRRPDRNAVCGREDVINFYALLLRRDPESDDAIKPRLGRPVADVFAEILRSKEFASRVESATAAKRFATPYRGSRRLQVVSSWAAERLPLAAETCSRLNDVTDWEDVDLALARDPAVTDQVAALREPAVRRLVERGALRRERGVEIEAVFVAEGRGFLLGRMDTGAPVSVSEIGVYREGESEPLGSGTGVARYRRPDIENRSPGAPPDLAGFWAIVALSRPLPAGSMLEISLTADRERRCIAGPVVLVNDTRLRDVALHHLATAQYFGEPTVEAFFQLDNGVGQALIDLNSGIVARILDGGLTMRFGARRASYEGTIIVCLYGKPEFLMLQAALFSQCPGYERYEFIYVSNSPELGEKLAKDATVASRLYGVAITLIVLPDNAGFGAANNFAAAAAQTDRLLFVNPDVLPRDREWPRRHAEMLEGLPAEQVRFFGSSLYYGDGSLMHGGMYIDIDEMLSIRDGKAIRRNILRVEHYGKGALAESDVYRTARPVPAVTGAFMSFDRAWFEKLGGFSRDYIFGHYEDVDLCLRSLEAGTPVWMHDLSFWHLESKGSPSTPPHLGGRLVNRWRMSSTWGTLVGRELNGRNPARFLETVRERPVPVLNGAVAVGGRRRGRAR
ncbi:MAG TPA: hypothetical protein VGR45_11825 [Stellaceae bacterium]|nr:hypothetical protein [Stellaceae bacterium]